MFQIFQKNLSVNFILLPLVVLLLWGSYLLNPQFVEQSYDKTPMILYEALLVIQNWNAYVGQIIAILLMGANILLLIQINTSLRLIEQRTVFYIFLYIICSASVPEFKQMNPMQPAMFFIILAVMSLYKMYKNEHELRAIFESGACLTIASLFYAPAIYFTPLVFWGLVIFVPFRLRQWLSGLVGIILPLIIVFALIYCFGDLTKLIEVCKINLFTEQNNIQYSSFFIVFAIYLSFLFCLSIVYTFWGSLRKVAIRKYYLILFVFLLHILFVYFFISYVGNSVLFFVILPITMFIPNYMVAIKRKVAVEILFVILLTMVILLQLFPELTLFG